ncbi:primary-amine oxidase [Pseudoclavibacter chungangensis]|uniref:Amine oxidase n=1 Tax=Pseudoclavibacter chungangensis TaxID=587635 RepID=A0A7J5BQA7_9MICO|nr:primary-amine oxidase [Pseudoclavibacter chungangensis]KAB1655683.1 primary-amine oxidase [Pseudoclavibacter chungangensis]NYJ67904.1 primary-amine oxidase [Pseudoclavibacter chungangensis]
MTTTTPHTTGKRVTHLDEADHPLAPLTADEIARGRAVIADAGLLSEHSRFPSVMPIEPPKDVVRAWTPGAPMHRVAEFVVLDVSTGRSVEIDVDLDARRVAATRELATTTAPYGQPAYLQEEYELAQEIATADPRWIAAMERRGLGDRIDQVFCSPLAPGNFGYEDEVGRRIIRSLTFLRDHPDDVAWAHPVEGLLVTIDLTERRVISVRDEGDVPVAAGSGRYDTDAVGPARTTLKPIEITQPEGPSFTVEDGAVSWENWRFRVGFNAREGLVIHELGWDDGERVRPIMYRGSIAEMLVPYGDTSANRYWISYFDAGEYYLGRSANTLALGCDCLGVIHYFDGMSHDDNGNPLRIPQAICMHEEDASILWKHTEFGYGTDVRRQRRLVISFIATIGNYDYGFYWHLYLDGTIEVEAKATGLVFNGSGIPGTDEPHRLEIAPGLFAPVHQHLFCARMDLEIDGERNAVDQIDVQRIPMGERNPYGNAFTWERTRVETEGGLDAAPELRRTWQIVSTDRTNALGRPTGYELIGEGWPTMLADPASAVWARASFTHHHTWVTRFHDEERWPAGKYPNQHAGGAGLSAYVADGESVDGEDLVVWHTFGPTHLPRPEDFPIMPVDQYRFQLKPNGFFDRNPTLDVPEWSSSEGHCCASERPRRYGVEQG